MKQRIALVFFFLVLIAMPFFGVWYSPSIPFKPNFPAIGSLVARQQAFIGFMVPKINYANQQILTTRTQIINLIALLQANKTLTYSKLSWLKEIADVYQVPHFTPTNPASLTALLNRVDTIPTSLVLAQAGNESGWGASHFAVAADNFFGEHCYVAGCGILLFGSNASIGFEVEKFNNAQESINDYLYNLNTNPAYSTFRNMRAELRAHNEPLIGFRLAPYLTGYSILGYQYVLRISSIIVDQNLMQYDAIDNGF